MKCLVRSETAGRVPRGCSGGCTTRSGSAARRKSDVEELAANAAVPVYNGLTDDWHPTQMLADFLTMHEASHQPYADLTYTYIGDARSNMGAHCW